ncbi:uncharacterized protein LOC108863713 [Galendromus occidentalis]|uniref:Uncharacterized protein LOC108863713 n=1 Tax=Galendromus occidentalis TaxID=34638 RepID=A0AAJ7L2G9_9ACAR|nr:uncharacterized protein LOC108863713 [Galendromus occidentalis]
MRKWQEKWADSGGRKGAWTKALIPEISKWVNRRHGELTYGLAQILTGHGKFQSYLQKIGRTPTDKCVYCSINEADDVIHTLYKCEAFQGIRRSLVISEGQNGLQALKNKVSEMLESAEKWEETVREIDSIMRHKTHLERQNIASDAANGAGNEVPDE